MKTAAREVAAAEAGETLLNPGGASVQVDIYISRGLRTCDYFLRVRAEHLADAQDYVARWLTTVMGRCSEPTDVMVGLAKPRQYITSENSAALDQELTTASFK